MIVNGHVTRPFVLFRVFGKGCALCPLIYVLSLVAAVRHDTPINGVPIPGTDEQDKVSAFVHNTTITLSEDGSAPRLVKDVAEMYGKPDGAKLNLSKSIAIRVE